MKKLKKALDFLADVNYNIFVADKKRGDTMSPRTGRPKIENPKSERITVRLDTESSKTLSDYCKQKNVEKAEAVRIGISRLKPDIK